MDKKIIFNKSDLKIVDWLDSNTSLFGLNSNLMEIVVPNYTGDQSEETIDQVGGVKDVLVSIRRNQINQKTDQLLSDGFTWNNIQFSLDQIHYNDYRDTVTYLKNGTLSYPFKIKGKGNNYYELQNDEDTDSFFNTGMSVKRQILSDGWTLKDGGTDSSGNTHKALSDMTISELVNFVDPR